MVSVLRWAIGLAVLFVVFLVGGQALSESEGSAGPVITLVVIVAAVVAFACYAAVSLVRVFRR